MTHQRRRASGEEGPGDQVPDELPAKAWVCTCSGACSSAAAAGELPETTSRWLEGHVVPPSLIVRWAADEFVCGLSGVTLTATARMLSAMTTRVGMAGAATLHAGLAQPGRRVSRRDVLPRTAPPA
jgi:hypothetical protein